MARLQTRLPEMLSALRERLHDARRPHDRRREVRSRTWLWSIADFAVFQVLYLPTPSVLGPVVANESLGGAAAWALTSAPTASARSSETSWRCAGDPSAPGRESFLCILLTVSTFALLAAAAELGAGVAVSSGVAVWETTLQENTPAQALSRVASYDWMGSSVLRPLGLASIGRSRARSASTRRCSRRGRSCC